MSLYPTLASAHGGEIDRLLAIVFIFIAALFLGWLTFFVIALMRFRSARNPQADYTGVRNKRTYYVEVGVVVFEVFLLVGFSIPFWVKYVAAEPVIENPVRVRVVAQQFAWNIHYPGADGVFGRVDAEFVDDQTNPVGIDPGDESGKDDIVTLNQLYLPKGRTVHVALTSKDVVHSFYLPEFRVKQDAVPGMAVDVFFTPAMSTAEFRALKDHETRTFEIVCAQLCGLGHYSMRGFVHVLEQDAFDAWLTENAPGPASEDDFWNEF